MYYIQKTFPVDAFKWTAGPDQSEDPEWIVKAIEDGKVKIISKGKFVKLLIKNEIGDQIVDRGDYLVKGIHGEIRSYKPEHFKEQYEPFEYPNRITIEASDDISNNRVSCSGKLSSADEAGLMMGAAIALVARIGGSPEDTRKLFELLIEDDGIKGVFDEQKNDSK